MSDPTNATPCSARLMASSLGSVCGLPKGHTGPHGEPTAPMSPPDPRPDVPAFDPALGLTPEQERALDAWETEVRAEMAERERALADPTPSGLTAAQEIRLEVFCHIARYSNNWTTEGLIEATQKAAQVIEHGSDETPILRWRQRAYLAEARLERALDLVSHRAADETVQVPLLVAALTWTPSAGDVVDGDTACPDPGCACGAADTSQELTVLRNRLTQVTADRDALAGDLKGIERCPDPALHDEDNLRGEVDRLADLWNDAELRVAELERQRNAALALLDHLDGLDSRVGHEEIRAIYAEHGDEVGGDGN